MVLTQLQLKWPNHSTHLLTRLTYLFKNEQLVDCTLMCNKHILKVHRSVLAACSPYFERELQNNPSIVVKDMQFSVLKALIEFMYYGETRITEENFTSLIEAAKIFEVKGLSEMDVMNGKNGIVSSMSDIDGDCVVESSCLEDIDQTKILQQSLRHATSNNAASPVLDSSTGPQPKLCNGVSSLYADSGGEMMVESSTPYEGLHSSRNFVVTPPQTESAQILLSLARSHNQKVFEAQIPQMDAEQDTCHEALLPRGGNTPTCNGDAGVLGQHSINSNLLFTEHNLIINDIPTTSASELALPPEEANGQDGGKSLLAKLLTRNTPVVCEPRMDEISDKCKNGGGGELQPSIILECPFLIETADGAYVDVCVENMLSAFDAEAVDATPVEVEPPAAIQIDDDVLQRIKHDGVVNELKSDPEAVVLCKVNEDGRLEKYVLSSADVQALKQMNERLAAAKQNRGVSSVGLQAEIEIPVSNSATPLITRVLDGAAVQNAISRLPFRRSGFVAAETTGRMDMLEDSLPVDQHHHENMFEELDNQFNMECSIEHIQREYVAYEEASKNETQLEHNYYANAMKDEDEECVVISDGYDLRMMTMMIEEDAGKKNKAQLVQQASAHDICLNGNQPSAPSAAKSAFRMNGVADKATTPNGKCDLINDALITSVLNAPPTKKAIKRKATDNVLPFKCVKSANTFRSSNLENKKSSPATKRTYKKKNQRIANDINSVYSNENNLVEEIIVDEIS